MTVTSTSFPRVPFLAGASTEHDALWPIKEDPKVMELQHTAEKYESSFAPEEFQRPESWSNKEKVAYFESILMNRLEGSFVFVDVDSALRQIEKINPQDRAYKFFQNNCAGVEYVIIDANNRFIFITDLINDKWRIPKGTYNVAFSSQPGDVATLVIGSHNNVFSKLAPTWKKLILQRKLVITEYKQISYHGLSQVFVAVNGGVPLNRQEKRNASDSWYAGWFRSLRKEAKVTALLILAVGKEYMKRLKGDEFLVDSVDYITRVTKDTPAGVSQKTKDTLYESAYFGEETEDQIRKSFALLADFVPMLIDEINDGKWDFNDTALTRGSTITNLLWLIYNGCDEYEDVKKALVLHEAEYRNPNRVNEDGNNYVWACGGLGAKNNELRMEVLNGILEKLGYQEEDEGPLYETA